MHNALISYYYIDLTVWSGFFQKKKWLVLCRNVRNTKYDSNLFIMTFDTRKEKKKRKKEKKREKKKEEKLTEFNRKSVTVN